MARTLSSFVCFTSGKSEGSLPQLRLEAVQWRFERVYDVGQGGVPFKDQP